MARPSYGPTVKARVKRLLEALLAYADYDILDSDRLKIQLERQKNQLVFRTKVRFLEELTLLDRHPSKLTSDQIKQALLHLKDFLKILVDNRSVTKGSDTRHFTLNLWSPDRHKNLERFDVEWEKRRPEKSKQLEAAFLSKGRSPGYFNTNFLEKRMRDWTGLSDESFASRDPEPLPPPQHSLLFDLLLQLDFKEEIMLVQQVIDEYKTAGFLVHGNNLWGGQQVCVQRFLRLKDGWHNNQPIKINVSVNFLGRSISNLWTVLAKKLCLPDPDPNKILKTVCDHLPDRDMIFIFEGVEVMGFGGLLSAWMQAFWAPLVEMTKNMSGRETHLLMFLVANSGSVSDLKVNLVDNFDQPEYPRLPLLLPLAGKFEKEDLEEWISQVRCHRDLIRHGLTAENLLARSDGIHQIVYAEICLHYDITWEGDLAQWLK